MSEPILYGSQAFADAGNVTLVENGFSGDGVSRQYTQTFKGTRAAIANLTIFYTGLGARTTQTESGGHYFLSIVLAYDPSANPSDEVPTDVYSFGTEAAQIDIYAHPRSQPYLSAGGSQKEAQYRSAMELFLSSKDGTKTAIPAGGTQQPNFSGGGAAALSAIGIYNFKYHGGTHYTLPRPTLRRTREYSLTYAHRRVIQNNPSFYVRASLISTFAIPSAIANLIPNDPTDSPPTGTAWGWRNRIDDAEVVQSKRGVYIVRETLDWEFAAFSTFFFDQV